MGIISRIINIAKSNTNSLNFTKDVFEKDELLLNEDDEELKQIIEELNQNNNTYENKNYVATKTQIVVPKEVTDAFDVLEVNEFSDKIEISEAFKNKLKMYHPDKHQNSSKEEKEFFIKKTAELIEAYNIIRNYKQLSRTINNAK